MATIATPINLWISTVGIDPTFGGVASVARETIRALNASPAISITRINSLLDQTSETFQPIFPPIVQNSTALAAGNRFKAVLQHLPQIWRRPRLILYDHIDIAQIQTLFPQYCRAGHAVWCHGIELWKQLPPRKLAGLTSARFLLFNSQFTRQQAITWNPQIESTPYKIVHLSAESSEFPTSPNPINSRPPHVLTVGRLLKDRPKGHREILSIWPHVVEKIPNAHWHIVGDGPDRLSLENAIALSSARQSITSHGFLPTSKLRDLFQNSQLYVMPSHGEGFGLVYAEAMAAGCIPLGSTRDAAPEVIADAGLCIDVQNPPQLIEAIVALLTKSSLASDLQKKSIARSRYFSHKAFKERLLDAINCFTVSSSSTTQRNSPVMP